MLELFFPPSCLLCERPLQKTHHPRLCRACRKNIAPLSRPHCSRCLMPFPHKRPEKYRCAACLHPGHFRQLYALGRYENGLAELIKRLKFQRYHAIAPTLGRLLAELPDLQAALPSYDSLIPVPLHRSTLRRRGFNQAALIGHTLSRIYRLKMFRSGLCKQRKTATQSELNASRRKENVRNAYRATRSFHGECCLLIDDVFTTGASAEACAAALQQAGALAVDVLTVARAV